VIKYDYWTIDISWFLLIDQDRDGQNDQMFLDGSTSKDAGPEGNANLVGI